MAEYIIAVDTMGGDNAPDAIVEGCMMALREFPDVRLMLFGPEDRIKKLCAADLSSRYEIIDAKEVIDMHESPTMAIRKKADSSLVKAMLAVKDKKAQAVLSAGSTGAVLAGGMFRVGRIPGIDRPALAPLVPGSKKQYLLIDVGANVDCQPRYLEQFGLMGSIYMQQVIGIKNPAVYLANIGVEEEKGDQLTKDAYKLMAKQTAYTFKGNVEAREIPTGEADVVVCDGFVGNVILKYTEGLAKALLTQLKALIMAKPITKLGGMLLRPVFAAFKKIMSTEEHGGGPLLGCKGAIIKAHGDSNGLAIKNAIRQARRMIEGDVVRLIEEGVSKLSPKEQIQEEN